MDSFSVFDFTITPFYYLGMCIWKVMLALIGVTAGETPQTFSPEPGIILPSLSIRCFLQLEVHS